MGQREVRFSSAGTPAFEYEKQRSALSCVQNFNDRSNPIRIEKVMTKSKLKNIGAYFFLHSPPPPEEFTLKFT